MPQVVIANPILNSPFSEPRRHFQFSDDGITKEIVEEHRSSDRAAAVALRRTAASRARP